MRKEELLSEPRMLGLSGEENPHEFVGPLCKLLEDFNIDLRSTVVEIGCFGGVCCDLGVFVVFGVIWVFWWCLV